MSIAQNICTPRPVSARFLALTGLSLSLLLAGCGTVSPVAFDALRVASGLSPSRLKGFRPEARRHRIAELMATFEPLRELPSFARLEAQLQALF